jgi:hypothetical protein
VSHVEITRHVAADPASVALLLAELASDEVSNSDLVIAAPRRTGVGFAAPLKFIEADGDVLSGEVVVEPSAKAGCDARVEFDVPERSAARQVQRAGAMFLTELAAHAKSRSAAA